MPRGPFSLSLRALCLLVYGLRALVFMPTGLCLLCLRALVFYACGLFYFVIDLHCYNVTIPCFSNYSSTFWIVTKSLISGHVERPSPRLKVRATSPGTPLLSRSRLDARASGRPGRPCRPDPASGAAAGARGRGAPESLNSTFEYYLGADDVPE